MIPKNQFKQKSPVAMKNPPLFILTHCNTLKATESPVPGGIPDRKMTWNRGLEI